jgi:MFS family permease
MKIKSRSVSYWVLAALFYLYEMILRASTSVMANDLQSSFSLNAEQLGLLSAMYYWAYTPLQIPCGLILDKMGSRKLITFSCLVCASSACVFSFTEDIWVACFARFCMGAGSASAFISTLSLIVGWFPPKHFALMAGLTNMMGSIGGVFAGTPLAWLMNQMGWRHALFFLGLIGFVLSFFTWFGIKDSSKEGRKELPLLSGLFVVIKKRQVWLAGIVGGLLYLPISAFAELWAVPFIEKSYGVPKEKAALVTMALYISMGLGSPLVAFFSDYMKSYTKVLKSTSVLAAFLFTIVAFSSSFVSFYAIVGIAALIGFALGGQFLAFIISKDNVPLNVSGTVSAVTNAIIMFFGLIFQPLLGYILDWAWVALDGKAHAGVPEYTVSMYRYAILSLPLCFIVGFLLLFFVKDTYTLSHNKGENSYH